jgi:tetratricopeptide (TPR) repeat protein
MMKKKADPFSEDNQAGYSHTTPSENRSVSILKFILSDKFVKAKLETSDKRPNIDGELEITTEDQKPLGKLEVQVKTLQKANYKTPKYSCKKGFLAYCNQAVLPVILITVNQQDKIAYWVHIDENVLATAREQIDGESVTIPIPASNRIDGNNANYLDEWKSILVRVKKIIKGYDELVNRVEKAEERAKLLEEKLGSTISGPFGVIVGEDPIAFHFSAEMQTVRVLRRAGDHDSALRVLDNERTARWTTMSEEQRYGWQVEMATTLFEQLEFEKAAAHLLGLGDYRYETKQKNGYLALGHLIKGEHATAEQIAFKTVANNPDDLNAYAVLIKLRSEKRRKGEELELVLPAELQTNPSIRLALLRALEDEGKLKEAIDVYERVEWADISNNLEMYDMKSAMAAMLVQVLPYPEMLLQGDRSGLPIENVVRAIKLLDEVVNYFKTTQLYRTRYYIHINRAIALKLAGRVSDSEEDFRKAYELHPDYVSLRYVMLNGPKSDWSRWLTTARSLNLTPEQELELAQLEAEMLLTGDRASDALEVLKRVEHFAVGAHEESNFFYVLLADVYLKLGRAQDIREMLNRMKALTQNRLAAAIITTKLALREDDKKVLEAALPELLEVTAKIDRVWARTMVFDLLTGAKRFTEAAILFRPISRKEIYTEYSRKLVECLFLAGKYAEAARWMENYIDQGNGDPFLIDAITTIYDQCKSRHAAIKIAQIWLTKHDNVIARIKLALLYISVNNFSQAKVELVKIPKDIYLLPERLLLLSRAYLQCEMGEGMELAYTTVKKAGLNVSLLQTYVEIMEQYGLFRAEMTGIRAIGLNSYVEIERESATLSWVIVAAKRFDGEIDAANPAFSVLFGKSVGEVITIDGMEYVISKVEAKFKRQYDEAKSTLYSMSGESEPLTGAVSPSLEETANRLNSELAARIKFGVDNGLFFELHSLRIGTNPIDFWGHSIKTYHIPLVAVNMPDDISYFKENAVANIPLLFDLFSLLLIDEMQWWSFVNQVPNRKVVSFAVLRQIEEYVGLLHQYKIQGDRRFYQMTDGRMVEQTITTAELQTRIEKMTAFHGHIFEQFTILEGTIPDDYIEYEQSVNGFGRVNAEMMREARQFHYCIISEDVFFRGYLQTKTEIPAGSLCSLSFLLFFQGNQNRESNDAVLAKLFSRGYRGIPIDPGIIKACFIQDDYQARSSVNGVFRTLREDFPAFHQARMIVDGLALIFRIEKIAEGFKASASLELFKAFFDGGRTLETKTILLNTIENASMFTAPEKDELEEAALSAFKG